MCIWKEVVDPAAADTVKRRLVRLDTGDRASEPARTQGMTLAYTVRMTLCGRFMKDSLSNLKLELELELELELASETWLH